MRNTYLKIHVAIICIILLHSGQFRVYLSQEKVIKRYGYLSNIIKQANAKEKDF